MEPILRININIIHINIINIKMRSTRITSLFVPKLHPNSLSNELALTQCYEDIDNLLNGDHLYDYVEIV